MAWRSRQRPEPAARAAREARANHSGRRRLRMPATSLVFIKEGRRRRAEETDKLFRTIGHGLVRVLRAVTALLGRFPRQSSQIAT
jgi:hypothetical protein